MKKFILILPSRKQANKPTPNSFHSYFELTCVKRGKLSKWKEEQILKITNEKFPFSLIFLLYVKK